MPRLNCNLKRKEASCTKFKSCKWENNKCSAAAAAAATTSEFENYEKEIGAATTPFHVLEKMYFFLMKKSPNFIFSDGFFSFYTNMLEFPLAKHKDCASTNVDTLVVEYRDGNLRSFVLKIQEITRARLKELEAAYHFDASSLSRTPPQKAHLNELYFVAEFFQGTSIYKSGHKYFYTFCRCYTFGLYNLNIPGLAVFMSSSGQHRIDQEILASGFEKFVPWKYDQIVHGNYRPAPAIRQAYVSDSGSKELNISMTIVLQDKESVALDVSKRIVTLLTEFQKISSDKVDRFDSPYIVYHGTASKIHDTATFVTTSFLSTTRDVKTAKGYGLYVYMIEIPARFPALNFNDSLKQILLPVGTTIRVNKTLVLKSYTVAFAEVIDEDKLPETLQLCASIFQYPCVKSSTVTLNLQGLSARLSASFLRGVAIKAASMKGSSSFYMTEYANPRFLIKDIVKQSSGNIRILNSDNQVFKRIFNEILASHIYSRVYGIKTFEYRILDKRADAPTLPTKSNYLIVSEMFLIRYNDFSLEEKCEIYKGFLVDCIMGNWDVFNNDNVGLIENLHVSVGTEGAGAGAGAGERRTKVAIRTDVGGALAFRGRGDEKGDFAPDNVPQDHALIACQGSFAKAMNIPFERQHLAADYLGSIDRATVKRRLGLVEKDFAGLLDSVVETEFSVRYKALLARIVGAVLYRDAWYRKHADEALLSIAKYFEHKIGGGGGAGPSVDLVAKEKEKEKEKEVFNGKKMNAGPMSFAASPGHFKRMLENHLRCGGP